MGKKRSAFKGLLTLSLLGALCLASMLLLYLSARIPDDVQKIFGPASQSLSTREHLTISVQLWLQRESLTTPPNPSGPQITFSIQTDEPTGDIIARLVDSGLLHDGAAFRNYLIYTGLDSQIQAGDYDLSGSMTAIEIAHEILDATSEFVTFNILAGWRIEEIAEALPSSGLAITPDEFLHAARNYSGNFMYSDQIPEGSSVEGFLLPGTYELPRGIEASEMIGVFLQRTESAITSDILTGIANQGLTLREAIILASVVEREAVLHEEQGAIAGVFIKRYKEGIPLEADPCVQYALGFNQVQRTWWTNPLTSDHLRTDSPYNTYVYNGLPPGPISNPGIEAIHATAFPEETPYYYFRAACDGSGRHLFAETFEQHQANACP